MYLTVYEPVNKTRIAFPTLIFLYCAQNLYWYNWWKKFWYVFIDLSKSNLYKHACNSERINASFKCVFRSNHQMRDKYSYYMMAKTIANIKNCNYPLSFGSFAILSLSVLLKHFSSLVSGNFHHILLLILGFLLAIPIFKSYTEKRKVLMTYLSIFVISEEMEINISF